MNVLTQREYYYLQKKIRYTPMITLVRYLENIVHNYRMQTAL